MATRTTGKRILLLGATGETGKHALSSLLASPSVASLTSFGRRAPTLPSTISSNDTSKMHFSPLDFESLLSSPPASAEVVKVREVEGDAVVIALGTTKAIAGGMAQFVRIDKDYVVAVAKEARIEGKHQVLVYCSSFHASSTSRAPYMKSKGLTEEALASLGYDTTYILRPGLLNVPGGRGVYPGIVESVVGGLVGFLGRISPNIQIQTTVLGRAMAKVAVSPDGLGKIERLLNGKEVRVVDNAELNLLGKDA